MNFSDGRARRDRVLSVVVIAGLHVLGGAVLIRGVVNEVAAKPEPVEVRLLEALPPLPAPPVASPTPPAPVPMSVQARPRWRPPAPVPTPVPQPEVVAEVPPPVSTAPTPEPVVATALEPAPAPVVSAAPAPVSIGVVCPTQVQPVMPVRALREGIQGTATARIVLKAGRVMKVEVSSRPTGLFDNAVRQAIQQYRCETTGDAEVVATQVFKFQME